MKLKIMNMPGFTADASLYEMSGHYKSEASRSFGNRTKDNQVHMQKPNSQNTPGGSCIGHTSGTTITGTYDSMGRCCIYPANAFPFCIDCDVDKCWDRRAGILGTLTSRNFQGRVFAPV
jgi:hypothetical protein